MIYQNLRFLSPSRPFKIRRMRPAQLHTLSILTADAKVRVQARQDMADIPLIGTGLRDGGVLLAADTVASGDAPAHAVEVSPVGPPERAVGDVVLVGVLGWRDGQLGSRCCRGAFEAGDDSGVEGVEAGLGCGADDELAGAVGVDDVGS